MTLAALLFSLAAILLHTSPSAAQQTDPDSQLPPPTLNAQAITDAIELRWEPVDGAARYELQSWTQAGGWQQLGVDNLTATTFNYTAPAPGVDHYYWVRAVDASGNPGEWSQRQTATLPEASSSTPTPTPTPIALEPPTHTPTPTAAELLTPTPTPTSADQLTHTPTPPTPTPTAAELLTPTPTPTSADQLTHTPTPPHVDAHSGGPTDSHTDARAH